MPRGILRGHDAGADETRLVAGGFQNGMDRIEAVMAGNRLGDDLASQISAAPPAGRISSTVQVTEGLDSGSMSRSVLISAAARANRSGTKLAASPYPPTLRTARRSMFMTISFVQYL